LDIFVRMDVSQGLCTHMAGLRDHTPALVPVSSQDFQSYGFGEVSGGVDGEQSVGDRLLEGGLPSPSSRRSGSEVE
jgi:hypothetical protein